MQIIIHTNILPTVQDIFNNTETANILKEWCVKAFAVTASFPPSAVQNGPNRDSPGRQLSGREAQGVRNTVQQPPAGQQHELRSETISTLRKIAAPELGSATYGTKQFRGPKSLGSAAAFERDHSTTVDPTSVTTKAAARRVVELVDANAARVIPETGPSQTPMMDNGCQTHAGGDDMEDLGGTKSTRENSGLAEAEKKPLTISYGRSEKGWEKHGKAPTEIQQISGGLLKVLATL
ncbi:hypothetical protein B0H16DRAFT_739436 [Mycena metata]|uniref:Uncharacterized protein n=1 Tax=Mycena metata TaxID=1033252 RepID=A0AAD7NCE7_9AGAR|nr:hypothetical protein B0H16DRAFT_739436 [Mycena metata]